DPIDSMRTPFMVADASPVDVVYDAGSVNVDVAQLEAIGLAGHSPNQMGLLVDGVFFAADVVLPDAAIDKYRIPYLYSLTDHLAALNTAAAVEATYVVPGHGPHAEAITPLLERNRTVIRETQELVLEVCRSPQRAADVMKAVLDGRGANVTDSPGYYLLQPTIAAYLTHLTRTGHLSHEVRDNESIWLRA
ncbi:MAG: hypothetical protein M3Y37_05150, partial [Chloroflexota bacterium]|nr:hypothetical protein [Chloroflexota bacterium]